MSSTTARIAKNTLMLYFRQILIMLVSLYTVRAVLETLGAEDYGIYNVVASMVTMFGFLSNSIATGSQRYFSFAIGRDDFEQLKIIFSLFFLISVIITLVVFLLAETVGLWFVSNILVIPLERKDAVLWVYQFSIISFLFTILTAPYMAAIIAHEDMNIYAYVSIIEVILKLGIVFLLRFFMMDKLHFYGILVCVVTIINTTIYRMICTVKYQECKFKFYWDKVLFKEITSYMGWSMFGSIAAVLKIQGINIVINQSFDPIVTAARSIALSIDNAVSILFSNCSIVINTKIVKNYASGDYKKTEKLIFNTTKLMYFLMYIVALPVIMETPYILSFWLKKVPDYTIVFTRLTLLESLFNSVTYALVAVTCATGKIKWFQGILNGIYLLNVPVSVVILSFGFSCYSVSIISLILRIIIIIVEFIIVKKIFYFSINEFIKKNIFPIICMMLVAFCLIQFIVQMYLPQGLPRLAVTVITNLLLSSLLLYQLGLNK